VEHIEQDKTTAMAETLMLSFVVPYYQVDGALLKRCLQSIILQNLSTEQYEIIVVDDGSEKSPVTMLEQMRLPNLRLLTQIHSGPAAARNRGIEEAKGKYIEFVDSDDYLMQPVIPLFLDLLEQYNADLLNFKCKSCYRLEIESTGEQPEMKLVVTTGAEFLKHHNLYVQPTLFLFRRSTAVENKVRFPDCRSQEDEEFTPLLYLACNKVICTNLCVYGYYQRQDSLSHQQTEEEVMQRIEVVKYILGRLNERAEELTGDKQQGLRRKISQLSMDLLFVAATKVDNRDFLLMQADWLSSEGLYPLPLRYYTWKYLMLAMLIHGKWGLYVFFRLAGVYRRKLLSV
jgi:glycosyltransferase involved in cell wall biosynthesis